MPGNRNRLNEQGRYEIGMRERRSTLGSAHVQSAAEASTEFSADFQDLATRYSWGEIWSRGGLDRTTRRLITIGMLVALNRHEDFVAHVRAALRDGVTAAQIKEALLHAAVYCGLPAADHAFRTTEQILAEPHDTPVKEAEMKTIEVATISTRIPVFSAALSRVEEYCAKAAGHLLGAFTSEIGELNKIMLVREFEHAGEAQRDQYENLLSGDPFGVGELATNVTTGNYMAFPFLPDVPSGNLGPFYEVRSYGIKLSAVQATIDAWERAVPDRIKISPLITAALAVGADVPHFINIWGYADLNARMAARTEAAQAGIWPPQGGPANLTTLKSEIFLAASFSPLA